MKAGNNGLTLRGSHLGNPSQTAKIISGSDHSTYCNNSGRETRTSVFCPIDYGNNGPPKLSYKGLGPQGKATDLRCVEPSQIDVEVGNIVGAQHCFEPMLSSRHTASSALPGPESTINSEMQNKLNNSGLDGDLNSFSELHDNQQYKSSEIVQDEDQQASVRKTGYTTMEEELSDVEGRFVEYSYDDVLEPAPHNYDLRPGPRESGFRHAICVDMDDSGNYNPELEAIKNKAKKRKCRIGVHKRTSLDDPVTALPADCEAGSTASPRPEAGNNPPTEPAKTPGDMPKEQDLEFDAAETKLPSDFHTLYLQQPEAEPEVQSPGQNALPERSRPLEPPRLGRSIFPTKRIMTTKLCHPISFNCEGGAIQKACHFCELPSYAVLGLGPRTVTVIDDPRTGITELEGGHHAEGHETTRICTDCTFRIMKISVCLHLDVCKLHEKDQFSDGNFSAAFERLLERKLRRSDNWCSICPSQARYRCYSYDEFCGAADGCGLFLCDSCGWQMMHDHGGRLGDFVDSLPEYETEDRPFGLRADAELLRRNGELAKYMHRE